MRGGSVQLPAGRETTALLAALEPACRSIFIRCNIQHAADRRQTPRSFTRNWEFDMDVSLRGPLRKLAQRHKWHTELWNIKLHLENSDKTAAHTSCFVLSNRLFCFCFFVFFFFQKGHPVKTGDLFVLKATPDAQCFHFHSFRLPHARKKM